MLECGHSCRMPVPSKNWFIASLPLWLFVILFKVGGTVFYSALSPLGEQVLPLWAVGVFIGAASLVQLVLDVPAGFLLDRFGYTRLLRISSLVLSLGGIMLLAFGLHIWTFVFLILVSGFGWLFFGPGIDAYALVMAPKSKAGRYMSMRRWSSSVGVVIGTVLFTLLLPLPISVLGTAIAIPLLLGVFVASFLKKEHRPVHTETVIETQSYYVRRTFLKEAFGAIRSLNPASGMLAFSGFTSSLFYAVIWFVLPLYMKDLTQLGPLQFGLGIFDATVILCGALIGKLADSRHKQVFVFFGLLVFAFFGSLSGLHLNGWFLIFGFIAAVGDELSCVSLWSWMNHLNRDHAHDGLVASLIGFFEDCGWVIGPVLAGVLYTRIGPSWTILVGCSFIFLNWLVSAVVLRRTVRSIFHSPFPPSTKPHRYMHMD